MARAARAALAMSSSRGTGTRNAEYAHDAVADLFIDRAGVGRYRLLGHQRYAQLRRAAPRPPAPRDRALPKYISSQMARSSKRSTRTPPSNFSIVTAPVKR